MVIFPTSPTRILSRIVAPPMPSSQQTSQTYTSPNLYLVNAGAGGLQANRLDVRGQIALPRNNETATGSPNAVTPVGSAGTAGLDGSSVAARLSMVAPRSAIVGPSSAPIPGTGGISINLTTPLLIVGAIIVGVLVLT